MKQGITKEQLKKKKTVTKMDGAAIKQYFEVYDTIEDNGTKKDETGKEKKKKKGKNASSGEVNFVEWVTYPMKDKYSEVYTKGMFPPTLFPDFDLSKEIDLDKEGRERYETFCGGFLFFHDVIFKDYHGEKMIKLNDGEIFEHKVYFEWFAKDGTLLNSDSLEVAKKVTIWITETPRLLNATPKDPPGSPPPY